jgi:hypothetical protein
MKKLTPAEKKRVKELTSQVKTLETALKAQKKVEGIDDNITVKVQKRDANFKRTKVIDGPDKAVGRYTLDITITSKAPSVFVPLSIASGKKPTGFIYHIEGTGDSAITTATVSARGTGIRQITQGTLEFIEIPKGASTTFRLQIEIRGQVGRSYQIVVNRINYKLTLADARYQQYQKPLPSNSIKFS